MLEKFKSFLANDTLFYGVLLILVAGASFGLGRQSVSVTDSQNIVIKQDKINVTSPEVGNSVPIPASAEQKDNILQAAAAIVVVGSKSGTKFHLPDCPGAKQIKSDNLITFESIDAAKAAGYTAAANCPGLK
jgi:hypothetical protein